MNLYCPNKQKPNLFRFHSTQNTPVFIDDGNIYIIYIIYTSMHDLTNLGRRLLITICYIKEVHKRHVLLYITNQWCYQCVSSHVPHTEIGYLVSCIVKTILSLINLSIYLLNLYFHYTYSNLKQSYPTPIRLWKVVDTRA